MKPLSILMFCSIILVLQACSTPKKPMHQASIPVESLNIKNRMALAHAFYQEKDYASALTQWKILRTIYPDNPEFKNRIRVMQALIKRRVKIHIKAGQEALALKNSDIAEFEFLKALAKDPRNKTALTYLQEIEAARVESIQIAKTKRLMKKQLAKTNKNRSPQEKQSYNLQEHLYLEMGINLYRKGDWSGSIREINKYLSTNENDQKAKNYVAKSHYKLSKVFENRGHLEPAIRHLEDALKFSDSVDEAQIEKLRNLKQNIAENYYENGIRAYRDNINQAIIYWQRAINYDPNHFEAKNRLSKATQIKEKLHKIQQ